MEITKVLASNLKRYRKLKKWSQADLAEAADISVTSLGEYETERAWPGIENIISIAKALSVSTEDLYRNPSFKGSEDLSAVDLMERLSSLNAQSLEAMALVLGKLAGISPLKRLIVLAILFEKPQILEGLEAPADFVRAVRAFAKAN